jgi:[ribosomal protein S18]-alanine N-acetyltransferase
VPSIIDLERSCASAAHWSLQQYREMLEPGNGDPQRVVLVSDESPEELSLPGQEINPARLLGFLVARHVSPEWELENIVVATAAHRTGLGTLLLHALLSAARATNSESVFLEVRESNTAARSLYERVGFRMSGQRKSYYANPREDAILYRLSLS